MGYTPSKRRREGQEAFCAGVNPMEIQPYKKDSWGYDHYLEDWLDGWKEAEETWEQEQKEETEINLIEDQLDQFIHTHQLDKFGKWGIKMIILEHKTELIAILKGEKL